MLNFFSKKPKPQGPNTSSTPPLQTNQNSGSGTLGNGMKVVQMPSGALNTQNRDLKNVPNNELTREEKIKKLEQLQEHCKNLRETHLQLDAQHKKLDARSKELDTRQKELDTHQEKINAEIEAEAADIEKLNAEINALTELKAADIDLEKMNQEMKENNDKLAANAIRRQQILALIAAKKAASEGK